MGPETHILRHISYLGPFEVCPGAPVKETAPAVGSWSPASMRSNVLLPAPLGPINANVCPGEVERHALNDLLATQVPTDTSSSDRALLQ